MIINRIGDFGLAIAIFTLYFYFKTLDYGVVFALAPEFAETKILFFSTSFNLLDFIGFFSLYRCSRKISAIRIAYLIT